MVTTKKPSKKKKTSATQSSNEEIQQLKEREKELNCLYGLTRIVRDKDISIDKALNEILNLIPPSWQYPDVTCARIKIDGKQVETSNFKKTPWKLTSSIKVNDEEMGHQEWILNDIAACGADADQVRNGEPGLHTEIMVAYAWDTIQRRNPVGFFGMVHVLEGISVQLATRAAGAIEKTLGLPKKAFTYLNSHGSLDISHVEFFKTLMNRLDKESDKQAVIHCAKAVYMLYGNIFRSLPYTGQKPVPDFHESGSGQTGTNADKQAGLAHQVSAADSGFTDHG